MSSVNNDPNHILVMHGSALVHAAYYLRIDCLRYLLEHEVECSDPAIIEQAIIACQQSVSAQVNRSLVATQEWILQILEKDWKGESGLKRRARVAERTLNQKRKPLRPNVLIVALATASAASTHMSINAAIFSSVPGDSRPISLMSNSHASLPSTLNGAHSGLQGKISSTSLGPIPTTHLYSSEGPTGPEIELISHNGFVVDPSVPSFQLADWPMPPSSFGGTDVAVASETNAMAASFYGSSDGSRSPYTTEIQGWRGLEDSAAPRLGQSGDSKNLFKMLRHIAKRS
ncbi:hypothetical protein EDD21DRAFT_389557 [Dissophora ornata]|nr:hypothetical protein EDD21DRAFT_389557 [Dissophora ornata]